MPTKEFEATGRVSMKHFVEVNIADVHYTARGGGAGDCTRIRADGTAAGHLDLDLTGAQ
ncbi:hypothetical protein GCM10007053_28660 [Halioglobus pacificus]|uniref:Uncharacterized protein n=1 Tax=Parahalioglobus pacificus TaxID=930806 RepID=A0A918XM01_9GAMM|nr:hypothetical protein GCM10007053_28660 [Halioglobus pacificus]